LRPTAGSGVPALRRPVFARTRGRPPTACLR
jgi:hypothetical protein